MPPLRYPVQTLFNPSRKPVRLIPLLLALIVLASAGRAALAQEAKLKAEDFTQVPNPKPATARQRAKWNSAAEAFNAAHRSLAEFCKGRGLFEEAAYHTEITRQNPGKPKARPNTAKAGDYRAYRALARTKLGYVADKWMEYARVAQDEGDKEQFRAGVCQALKTYTDHATARETRDEGALEGLGWLPAARVEALNAATREGLSAPDDVAVFDARFAKPGAGYVLLTKHFAVCSTAAFGKTAKLAAGFDTLYEAVSNLLGESAALGDERIGVFIYGTGSEFAQANAQRGGASWSGGFYRARTGLAHFPLYGDSEPGARVAANHELTHAVVDCALRGRPFTAYDGARGKQSRAAFFCVAEGVAMHFEPFNPDAKEQKLGALSGRENSIKALKAECRDLEALFKHTAESWAADDADTIRNYAAASAFAEFCLKAEGGKFAPNFVKLLVSHYGRELAASDFEAAFGAKRADFDAAYLKWFDERFK